MPEQLKFFEPTEFMKALPCEFCGEQGVDMCVQENSPGGAMLVCHQKCLDKFME